MTTRPAGSPEDRISAARMSIRGYVVNVFEKFTFRMHCEFAMGLLPDFVEDKIDDGIEKLAAGKALDVASDVKVVIWEFP